MHAITVPGGYTGVTGVGAKREREMQELSRIVTSTGAVAASVGLVVYGMGTSYHEPGDMEMTLGIWLMVLGAIATIGGLVAYNRSWSEAD
jgi:hypothetical protein